MANPVTFEEVNRNWQKPQAMTDDECGALPAYVDESQSISCWELTAEELVQVKTTGKIWLGVMGSQPPVWITGLNPFGSG